MSEAETAGKVAFLAGKQLNRNPYSAQKDQPNYLEWMIGYEDASTQARRDVTAVQRWIWDNVPEIKGGEAINRWGDLESLARLIVVQPDFDRAEASYQRVGAIEFTLPAPKDL